MRLRDLILIFRYPSLNNHHSSAPCPLFSNPQYMCLKDQQRYGGSMLQLCAPESNQGFDSKNEIQHPPLQMCRHLFRDLNQITRRRLLASARKILRRCCCYNRALCHGWFTNPRRTDGGHSQLVSDSCSQSTRRIPFSPPPAFRRWNRSPTAERAQWCSLLVKDSD